MDDSCAVCAETLEWVAYGFCGHREVCSTCVIRLRFICDDRRCCICKSESNFIFVTKALGDYTRSINDFSAFPADPIEGQVGPYWYHEGTQAYFDDLDHYKMIKAMCKLSCTVCDNKEEQRNVGPKRGYKNIEQLRSHLFNRHRLFMCSLCLEGRKIFICEQKLYTKGQLNQHVKTGDSEVDGSESQRGGFMGHPMCEFCQNPFYGDNELYLHMSTEHYTCHICQRQHPGQYEYYKNYDDLEIHFRQEHFLCEDEACLQKKFIVFVTESEMKRHNAKEHGGHMSRSKRNAALQIPISFHYRRSNEQDRRGRGHGSRPDSSDSQLSLAIQASLETANAERLHDTSSSTQAVSSHRETIDTIGGSFELLATTESEPSSRYHQALGQNSRNSPLEQSSFPPLPMASNHSQQKSGHGSKGLGGNSMAARLRQRNNGTVTTLNSSRAWPAASRQSNSSASSSYQSRPVSDSGLLSLSSSPSFSRGKPATVNGYLPSSYSSSTQAIPVTAHGFAVSSTFASSSKGSSSSSKVNHSASAPNLVYRGSVDNSISNFPPFSAAQINKVPTSSRSQLKVEDVQSANKALVEKIRAVLEFDEDKYTAFKVISADYRQNLINTGEYLANVHQFGLSHLVLELARLCPDARKQRELVEIYNFNMRSSDSGQSNKKKGSKKGKEKCQDNGISGSINASADSINLLSNHKLSVEEVEVLLKGGYHSEKGKSKIFVDEQTNTKSANQLLVESRSESGSQSANGGSKKNLGTGGGGNKARKKTPKFLRNRLGDTLVEALSDLGNSDPGPDQIEEKTAENKDPPEGFPVRGVWQNGGGRLLVARTQRKPKK